MSSFNYSIFIPSLNTTVSNIKNDYYNKLPLAIIMLTISIVAIIGNSLVILAISQFKNLRTVNQLMQNKTSFPFIQLELTFNYFT